MAKILTESFFNRDTKIVAKELLGKFLVRKIGNKKIIAVITETEAYDGPNDKASHASRDKTKKTEVMFGNPGTFYVYFCYGMHYMLNIVTREKGYPAAILIRRVVVMKNPKRINLSGPGKLTKFLKIDKKINGKKANRKTSLWFERSTIKIKSNEIEKASRVGVAYAGPAWSSKKLRFILNYKNLQPL